MQPLEETLIIFQSEWRRTVQSARIIVLLGLYALFSGTALFLVGALVKKVEVGINTSLEGASDLQRTEALDNLRKGALGFLFSGDSSALEVLQRLPIAVLLVFKITLFFLPLYIALMGFDQISGEVAPRSMRYLTVRARRGSILVGKFFGQLSVLATVLVIIQLGVTAYAKFTYSSFGWPLAAETFLRLGLASGVFSISYLALSTLCSSLVRSPAVALVLNVFALFGFVLVESIGAGLHEANPQGIFGVLRYFSPSHYSSNLLHPLPAKYLASGGAFVGFAMVFLGLAYLGFRRRDV